ncbi:hypothetical protein [Streptomyces prasinosporus]|uniref:hypothetical protein n=1 Tax=Streptomyces prasinosporus TaxID=68256 RepID=UPI0031F0540D
MLNPVRGGGTARQTLPLGLLAVLLALLPRPTRCLREAGAHHEADRAGRTANAYAEPA